MDSHNFCKKHVMRAQFEHLLHFTLDINRRLPDHRCGNLLRLDFRQFHLFELIHISSRAHAAVVGRIAEVLRRQVDDERTALFDHLIAVAFRPHRDRYHRRIRTHRAGPGNGDDVVLPVLSAHRHHDRRQRIQHISRFPCLFSHSYFFPFLFFTLL